MVALLIFLDTFLSIFALELGQLARNFVLIALWVVLIAVITTVEISVTHFLSSDPETAHIFNIISLHRFALVIARVLIAIVAVSLVTFVQTIVGFVTSIVLRYAVGGVELVGTTGEFAGLAVGWRAIVVFILSIVTVLVVIADPSLRYTLAGLSTLELVSTASLRHALSVLHHDGGLSVIGGNGTARATVAPLAPTAYVMTSLVHLRGAPGLVFCEMSRHPGTLVVDHSIKFEGENTWFVC